MAYEINVDVTSFDVMSNSSVKPSALFKYYQEAAGGHLDLLGLDFNTMREKKCVFVITRMKNVFYSPIKRYDKITVRTSSRGIKGASFTRDYSVLRGGEVVAEASTQWVLINLDTRRICRPAVYAEYFGACDECCSFGDIKKIDCDTDFDSEYKYKVVFSDIDENLHMNNTRYSDICLDAIEGTDAFIEEVSVDFLSEARLGDELMIKYVFKDGRYLFSAENITTGKRCFTAEIKV